MEWSYGRDGKIWEKHVGKVWKICQNKKIIGKRYHWKWHIEIPKYDKDEKWWQNMQLSACDKKNLSLKSPIGFYKSQGPPHHEDKKVWSCHIYAIGSNKSPFYRGKAQTFLFPFFTSHQIWLNPIVGRSPTYLLHKFEKKETLAKTSKLFTLKLIIEIL